MEDHIAAEDLVRLEAVRRRVAALLGEVYAGQPAAA